MTVGVPQGSVLGPTLWNVLYDGILRQELGEGTIALCFADDLAILVKEDKEEILMIKANEALRIIDRWLIHMELELAPNKTEAVVLKGKRNTNNMFFELQGIQIKPKKSVKYLGIVLGSHSTYGDHVNAVVKKAEGSVGSMSRLMPNIGGPRSQKRVVLSGVVHSILLYGAPIWHKILNVGSQRLKMERVQRKILLRVASAYRTSSTRALQVITGIAPIELQVEERRYIYHSNEGTLKEKRQRAKDRTTEKWQEMWEANVSKAQWTKKIIPNIANWIKCQHRDVDYYTTQVLTGHGSFRSYTKRFRITDDEECIYCAATDTVEHTLFQCPRWEEYRQQAYSVLDLELNAENLTSKMVESKDNWDTIKLMIKGIMKNKEREKNQRQRQENDT